MFVAVFKLAANPCKPVPSPHRAIVWLAKAVSPPSQFEPSRHVLRGFIHFAKPFSHKYRDYNSHELTTSSCGENLPQLLEALWRSWFLMEMKTPCGSLATPVSRSEGRGKRVIARTANHF